MTQAVSSSRIIRGFVVPCHIRATEMPEVGGVTSNDIDVIVKVAGKVAVSEILRSRDDEVTRTTAVQMFAPKEGMNQMHDVDHVADGKLAVARYI